MQQRLPPAKSGVRAARSPGDVWGGLWTPSTLGLLVGEVPASRRRVLRDGRVRVGQCWWSLGVVQTTGSCINPAFWERQLPGALRAGTVWVGSSMGSLCGSSCGEGRAHAECCPLRRWSGCCRLCRDSSDQARQQVLCQQAGQTYRESFKLD